MLKLELQQHNTRLAEENTLLRMELSILRTQTRAATVGERRTTLTERMAARKAAVHRLAQQYPLRKSFTEAEVLGAMD